MRRPPRASDETRQAITPLERTTFEETDELEDWLDAWGAQLGDVSFEAVFELLSRTARDTLDARADAEGDRPELAEELLGLVERGVTKGTRAVNTLTRLCHSAEEEITEGTLALSSALVVAHVALSRTRGRTGVPIAELREAVWNLYFSRWSLEALRARIGPGLLR